MARKGQLSIQDSVETDEEFEAYLEAHFDKLICMEVYSEFCGPSQATQNAVRKGKLEIGGDDISMVKAMTDKISYLERFRYKSEPCFIFIFQGKLTNIMFGANGIELCNIIESELAGRKRELEGGTPMRKYEFDEMLPIEAAKIEADHKMDAEIHEQAERLRVLTLAARKKRVCERMINDLRRYNFIMFFPHCHHAHYDLYEKWDYVNITVAAKEEFQITEDNVKEVLYMSDIDPNEACLHAMMKGPVLVVLFKMFDTDDRNFVKVMRYALYEQIPEPKEDVPPEKQVPPIPAFERYATISKTAREVRRDRYEAKLKKMREEQEERDRLKREQERMAREAEEERLRAEKQRKEEEKMARLAAGLPAEPEPEIKPEAEEIEGEELEGEEKALTEVTETTDATDATEGEAVPEEEVHEEQIPEFHSDIEIEDEEYIPPGGLFVPGLYSPPNELAKTNGLKFFFPKVIGQVTKIESEYLPPHVLVMFSVDKRHEVMDIIEQFKDEILNYGIFVGDDPFNAEHVAYTIKQYDKMVRLRKHLDRVAVAVSRKRSLPLLQLAGLNPCYISSDVEAGERDCLTLFPVGYGDDYEEVESIKESKSKSKSAVKVSSSTRASKQSVKVEEEEEDEG